MIDGKNVDVYEQVGFFAGMFAPDQWGTYPAATSMDVSASDTLKMTMWRTDSCRFRLTLLSDGGVAGAVNHSAKVYFDDSDSEVSNGPVPAGEWHTLEIPMEQFTDIDPSTVTGFVVTSVHYIEELDADGNQVLTESREPSILEVPSRETIYMDEIYFSTVPDAPRSVIEEAPGYADADVAAVSVTSTPRVPLTWTVRRPSALTRW